MPVKTDCSVFLCHCTHGLVKRFYSVIGKTDRLKPFNDGLLAKHRENVQFWHVARFNGHCRDV